MAYGIGGSYLQPAWMKPKKQQFGLGNINLNTVNTGAAQGDVYEPPDTEGGMSEYDYSGTITPPDIEQRGLLDGGQPGSPTANRRRGGRVGGQYRQDWKFDPITGKPIVADDGTTGSKVTLPTKTTTTATGSYDFWAKLRELMDDPNDKMADETWQGLVDAYEGDSKWKAPTSAAAQRLLTLALAFKNMGYEADQLAPLVQKALEMGYSTPKFSLSLFNRILSPYGLGTGS